MNAILYKPANEDTDIILLILGIFSDHSLLNRTSNLELQHWLLRMFQQILAFWEQSRGALERIQHALQHQHTSLRGCPPRQTVLFEDSTLSENRSGNYIDAVAGILKRTEQLGEGLRVTHGGEVGHGNESRCS
jgi:hypothetical protein